MKILFVNLEVKEEFVEEFAEFTRKNHEGSVKEAGNIRFDALRDKDNPAFSPSMKSGRTTKR